MFTRPLHYFRTSTRGQGISEYGAILAFLAAMIVALMSVGKGGGLSGLINQCFSSAANSLNLLNKNAK